jgi:hypothetical protein
MQLPEKVTTAPGAEFLLTMANSNILCAPSWNRRLKPAKATIPVFPDVIDSGFPRPQPLADQVAIPGLAAGNSAASAVLPPNGEIAMTNLPVVVEITAMIYAGLVIWQAGT